jgi:hypothetical protein
MMGTNTELVVVELATVTQFVPKPPRKVLVCACKTQPVWSAGHDVRWVGGHIADEPIGRHQVRLDIGDLEMRQHPAVDVNFGDEAHQRITAAFVVADPGDRGAERRPTDAAVGDSVKAERSTIGINGKIQQAETRGGNAGRTMAHIRKILNQEILVAVVDVILECPRSGPARDGIAPGDIGRLQVSEHGVTDAGVQRRVE